MTKQDLTNIITDNIATQLQKPKDALTNITKVYGQWLRRTVKEAQIEANQNKQTADSNAAESAQQGATNV